LYDTTTAYVIAERIDRTEAAVWVRARTLGLDKREEVTAWSEQELATLRRCYATEPPARLAERLGRTTSSIYWQAQRLGLSSHKALVSQSVVDGYFDAVTTAEQAYILGLLAADGCVSDACVVTFGLQAKDVELVRFVRDKLAPMAKLSVAAKTGFTSFRITSRPMASALKYWSIVPRKSCVIQWPTALGSLLRPFLLGYFDGDGCAYIFRHGRRIYPGWSVCSGSLEFLVQMKDYIHESTGIVLEKIHKRPRVALYQVATTGKGAYLLDQWLHQDGLGLKRKRLPDHVVERYRATAPRIADVVAPG
jgi:hypothetical protein